MSQLTSIVFSICYIDNTGKVQLQKSIKALKAVDILCILLPLCSLLLWSISLKSIDVRQMNDLGLISVMPPLTILALCILLVSFALTLQRSQIRVPIIVLHFCLLIFMLYGITTLVEEEPRFSTVYRHAGYTEYIMRNGSVDPDLDTYFNWPGFFILSALVTRLTGYHDVFPFAVWAPVFFNLIYAGPLYMIFTSITIDKRLAWLGLWFFYLTNWIGQDYFSPQGLNFFLYLVIIAILLRWFKVEPKTWSGLLSKNRQSAFKQQQRQNGLLNFQSKSPQPGKPFLSLLQRCSKWLTAPDTSRKSINPQQGKALVMILITIIAFVIYSHPLTPFFVLASVTALVVFRRCNLSWLPILVAAMTGAWIIFMAQGFLAGHAYLLTGTIGKVNVAVSTNVTNRAAQGNAEHDLIAQLCIITALVVWGLAFLGGAYRLFRGQRDGGTINNGLKSWTRESDVTYVLLAIVPFPLLLAQSYGGEMILRIYLFALPMMVFFIASLFYLTTLHGKTYRTTVAIILISIVLLSSFLFTRYGNENMDYMTHNEVQSVRYLYSIAPAGSAFIQAWRDAPWQFQDYEKYGYYSLEDDNADMVVNDDISGIIQFIKSKNSPDAYILFTRSQKVTSESFSGLPKGTLNRLEATLLQSGKFKLIYQNPDAQLFIYSAY